MLDGSVNVVNPLGLHARAAAQLVRVAGMYKSRITLHRPDSNAFANAKSILSVLALAAAVGTTLRVEADGEDEGDAFSAITGLFENGFGEI
ncbi:MAG: HPr family phosphocarrier protein [Acidobacteria bacterium]|nr:MAG: HPr family phosphocarrier protein [Acidobacteriota bacterium]